MRNFAPVMAAADGPARAAEAAGDSSGSAGTAGSARRLGGHREPVRGFAAKALRVQGNKLVDTTGATVRLLGVNRAGTRVHVLAADAGRDHLRRLDRADQISAMMTWHINTVRLPLNESCWLGINGALVTAEHYRDDIDRLRVTACTARHLRRPRPALVGAGHHAITGGSGGNQLVTMAFADHAIDFWTSVATTFKDDPMVIFDLFNEPILDANDRFGNGPCRRPVGLLAATAATSRRERWPACSRCWTRVRARAHAGRRRGRHRLGAQARRLARAQAKRSDGNLMAGFHVYQRPLSDCDTQAAGSATLGAVAQQVPVLTGEMGEQDCAHGFIDGSWLGRRQGPIVPRLGVEPAELQHVPGADHRLRRHADHFGSRPAGPPDQMNP